MFQLNSLALFVLTISSTVSSQPHGPWQSNDNCLTAKQASNIGHAWVETLSNFSNGLVDAFLADNFTDYSSSALSLNSKCLQAPAPGPEQANPDLSSPLVTDLATFKLIQGHAAPLPATIFKTWNDCDTVTMRWTLTGTGTRPVNAVIVFDTIPVKKPATYNGVTYPRKTHTIYSEFDSEAWVQNLVDSKTCKDPLTGEVKSN